MPLPLLIHNTGYIISIILSLALGVFVLIRGWNKKQNILFFLINITWIIYAVTYLVAVNVVDKDLSLSFSVFNMVVIATVCFNAHLAFAAFGEEKKQKAFLIFMYVTGAMLLAFLISDPSRFHVLPESQAYFVNFITPGRFYWLFTLYFFIVVSYFLLALAFMYRKATPQDKMRLKYFIVAFALGYGSSIIGYMNVFDIGSIDEVYTVFIGMYVIPLAYGVFKYNLVDIRVMARNILIYGFYMVVFAALLTGLNIVNNYFLRYNTDFPIWLLPLAWGAVIIAFAIFMLRKLRESDDLKYEFINNISHKFRTPLTHIRSLADDLRYEMPAPEREKSVDRIQFESIRLFELTNIVMNASGAVSDAYQYQFGPVNLYEVVREIGNAHKNEIDSKKLNVVFNLDVAAPKVRADRTRILFALQILFENAISYTPMGGTIDISVVGGENNAQVIMKDTGIGINEIDLPHVFSKFYRSQNARRADTEGLGIGLYMAKGIVEKHQGNISATSEGENKGATISVILPAINPTK